jgi:hypothetical protein
MRSCSMVSRRAAFCFKARLGIGAHHNGFSALVRVPFMAAAGVLFCLPFIVLSPLIGSFLVPIFAGLFGRTVGVVGSLVFEGDWDTCGDPVIRAQLFTGYLPRARRLSPGQERTRR